MYVVKEAKVKVAELVLAVVAALGAVTHVGIPVGAPKVENFAGNVVAEQKV